MTAAVSLAEDRLELAVESHRLGPGERVIVLTKMGEEVARGRVIEVYPDSSVYIRESGPDSTVKSERIYDPSLYSFVPVVDERGESDIDDDPATAPDPDDDPTMPPIEEQDPDARAEKKLKDTGTELEPKDGDSEPAATDKGNGKAPRSVVDVDSLPDHLKKEIVGLEGLDEAARNEVISAISDAALRSLRDVGVRDTEVYSTIVKIQKSLQTVLSI